MSSQQIDNASDAIKAQVARVLNVVHDHQKWFVPTSTSTAASTSNDIPIPLAQLSILLQELDTLKKMQPAFKVVDTEFAWKDRTDRLFSWLKSHPSFKSGGIELADDLANGSTGANRGVRATEAIAQREVIMSVPLDLVISTETAIESRELGPLIETGVLQHIARMRTILLGLHTLVEHAKCIVASDAATTSTSASSNEDAEKNKKKIHDTFVSSPVPVPATVVGGRSVAEIKSDRAKMQKEAKERSSATPIAKGTKLSMDNHPWGSRYRAFFACLPSSAEEIGNCLSWKADDFKMLAGLSTASTAIRMLRDIAKAYCTFYTTFVEGGMIDGLQQHWTWAHFQWVMAIVMSRQNMTPSRDFESQELSLMPLYDMVNHEPGNVTSYFVGTTGAVELNAGRAFAKGEEVTMSYGGRSHNEFLIYQGFVPSLKIKSGGGGGSGGDIHSINDGDEASFLVPGGLIGNIAKAQELQQQQQASSGTSSTVVAVADTIGPLRIKMLENMMLTPPRLAFDALAAARAAAGPDASGAAGSIAAAEVNSWALPFRFDISQRPYGGVVLPQDFIAFCRVAALTKPEAPLALRALQSEVEKAKAEVAAAKAAKIAAKQRAAAASKHGHARGGGGAGAGGGGGGGGGHGHSHGGKACGGHGHGQAAASHDDTEYIDEDDIDEFDDDDDDDEGGGHGHSHGGEPCGGHGHGGGGDVLPPVFLPRISDANEATARAIAVSTMTRLIANLGGTLDASTTAASAVDDANAAGAGTGAPQNSVSSTTGTVVVGGDNNGSHNKFINIFLQQQINILKSAAAVIAAQ